MKTIVAISQQVIAEFSQFEEWMDKYQYLIEMGKDCPVLPEKDKTEQHLINGCQSRVWLKAYEQDGFIYFEADSDAVITKGIAALLIRVFSGHPAQEIIDAEVDFIDQIGLREHLSPTRSNGLTAMIKQMKLYAMAFQAKNNSSGH